MWKKVLVFAFLALICPVTESAKKKKKGLTNSKICQRSNSKAFSYCKRSCSLDGQCSNNEKCLCDGDCGMSCVKNKLRCKPPPKPKNSQLTLSDGFNFGSVVTYKCSGKYKLRGSASRTCRAIGKWDGRKARCNELEVGTDTRGRAINLNSDSGLDLVFVIDASCSVTREGFKLGLKFAKEFLRIVGLSRRRDGTRIALVTFGTEAKLEFNLGDAKVDTMEKAIKAIDKVHYAGGATASAKALKMVRRVVVPNARGDSKRAMFFITYGKSNIGRRTVKEAKYLRGNEDFEIYAVGVGKKVNFRELTKIASAFKHVIKVRNFKTLKDAIKKAVTFIIDYSICGESIAPDFRERIVGGSKSQRGWWPWQVGIYKVDDIDATKFQRVCGGALISKQWVLTAAHCFFYKHFIFQDYRFERNGYQIKAGDHHLEKKENTEQAIEIKPEMIFVHQGYVDRVFINDIALVKLEQKVELGKFVRTVCLPEKNDEDLAIPTRYGFAAGWGATQALEDGEKPSDAHRYSKVLKFSPYEIQQNRLCANKSVLPFNSTVSFCAGDGKGGNDTCHGDGGGAFVREVKRGTSLGWVAVGLVSWGKGCAQKGQYGYYTRVYPFIDWIRKTVNENKDPEDERL